MAGMCVAMRINSSSHWRRVFLSCHPLAVGACPMNFIRIPLMTLDSFFSLDDGQKNEYRPNVVAFCRRALIKCISLCSLSLTVSPTWIPLFHFFHFRWPMSGLVRKTCGYCYCTMNTSNAIYHSARTIFGFYFHLRRIKWSVRSINTSLKT